MSETFEFKPEYLEQAKEGVGEIPGRGQQSAVLALLDIGATPKRGWSLLTPAAMDTIAEMLDMAPIRV